jgi:hypothetical protein
MVKTSKIFEAGKNKLEKLFINLNLENLNKIDEVNN